MSEIKLFNVGVKGVIVRDKKVLLLKRDLGNGQVYWDIPGGRIDCNEDIIDTLNRELVEEIPSIKSFEIKEILHVYRLPRDIEKDLGLLLIFYKVNVEDFQVKLSGEHCGYKWFDKEMLNSIYVGASSEVTYIEQGYKDACLKSLLR